MDGTEPFHGSCQSHRKELENAGDHQGTSAQAFTNRRGLRSVAGGLLHLCLEEVNGIRSRYPLERIPVPAALDHGPHAVRDFGMNRS